MDDNKKAGRYERIIKQFLDLVKPHNNSLAVMSTAVALLHNKMDQFFWTGFYLLDKDELIVGPYQGPPACIGLHKNTGVCWACLNKNETVIVPDVHKFPGHIACDSRSNSEIVIPLRNKAGNVFGVLDVDSKDLNAFNETDALYLEKMITEIGNYFV